MPDEDLVFKALADPTRRFLLHLLYARDGRTLTELESEVDMTRFGVMKHLKLLEEAELVVSRKEGRETRHFLNPIPIRRIHDRWAGTRLTVTHDVTGAPNHAALVSGAHEDINAGPGENAGGGWAWVLSDLKSVLETGKNLTA